MVCFTGSDLKILRSWLLAPGHCGTDEFIAAVGQFRADGLEFITSKHPAFCKNPTLAAYRRSPLSPRPGRGQPREGGGQGLRSLGFAVRRGDTFPGLDGEWLRLAVRDRTTVNGFLQALDRAMTPADR